MSISTWEWIRILGFLAYFYFTIAIVFGLLRKSSFITAQKNLLYQIHQSASWFGLLALIGHMIVLTIDQYQPYTLKDLLIPFANEYATIPTAFGIIAFYLFFIVIFTSDVLIKRMKGNIWKGVHMLVLPAWLISLVHGILIGTDSDNPFVLLFYGITAGITILVMLLRYLMKEPAKKQATTTRETRSATTTIATADTK